MNTRTDCGYCQELFVHSVQAMIEPMVSRHDVKQEFSTRFNYILDLAGIAPKGKGRQGVLAKMFDVSDKGARKWIEAESIPSQAKLIEIVNTLRKEVPGLTVEWLLTGNEYFSPDFVEGEIINKQLPSGKLAIESGGGIYVIEKRQKKLQIVNWNDINLFFNCKLEKQETMQMPTNEITVSDNAIMVKVTNDNYSPYVNAEEVVIVDLDKKPEPSEKVIVLIDDTPHIMKYDRIEQEYLYPVQPGSFAIPLTETLNYKIIGVIVWIIPAGRKG